MTIVFILSFYFFYESLKAPQILNIFALGSRYTGHFQGNLVIYRNFEVITPLNLRIARIKIINITFFFYYKID